MATCAGRVGRDDSPQVWPELRSWSPLASSPAASVFYMEADAAAVSEVVAPESSIDGLLPKLKGIFRDAGVPEGLVWMAEVESSWDPHARSTAGAVGLFQFMPETAARFGLDIGSRDDRVHPYRSARAAAEYLRFLHERFGSWRLALAAYNAGEGRVDAALAAAPSSRFEEVALYLPLETQEYVPLVMATIELHERGRGSVPRG